MSSMFDAPEFSQVDQIDDVDDLGGLVAHEPDWPQDDPGPGEPPPEEPDIPRHNGNHVRSSTDRQVGTVSGVDSVAAHQRYPVLDWHRLFDGAPDDIEWLVPDFIARGQSYALVSPAKAGKSLLMLDVVAAIAAGRTALGSPRQDPVQVLYVDHENSRDDLLERLRDMGYQPADLGALRYLSFPTMPPLDGPAGGQALVELAEYHTADVVVIDTLSRVVAGEENSADTYRALYRHALAPLKAAGRAVVRLDHRGKDAKSGARGSSAKNDDVDVVWQLAQQPMPDGDASITLRLERQRGSAHPDEIHLHRRVSPQLRHVTVEPDLTYSERERIAQCIEAMKSLHLPADTGARKARLALREREYKFGNTIIAAAVKARKILATCPDVDRDTEAELF
jgi:AAA domain